MDNYVIGVDGGGTKTIGVLANYDGSVLAQFTGGASNYQVAGGKKLKAELENIFNNLLRLSKFPKQKVSHIYLGLAGAGRESDRSEIKALLADTSFAKGITVESDARVALAGAFGGKPGIILIAGTGAICFGKNVGSPVVRAGGWGYLLGDEGSGFFIGQQAIIAALKDLDGRSEKTSLRQLFESKYRLKQLDEIIPLIYKGKIDRTEISNLAPLVYEASQRGDAVAMNIIRSNGQELGKLARAVAEKLNLRHKPIHIAIIGGLFNFKEAFVNEIYKELYELSWDIEISEPRFPPAIGAVILSLEKCGVKINNNILENLSKADMVKQSGQ